MQTSVARNMESREGKDNKWLGHEPHSRSSLSQPSQESEPLTEPLERSNILPEGSVALTWWVQVLCQ